MFCEFVRSNIQEHSDWLIYC